MRAERLAGLVLAIAGLVVSVYLAYVHYADPELLSCPGSGVVDCAKVTTSPESVILGIPVAVLGLPFFAVMAALNLPGRGPSWLTQVRTGTATTGVLFVLYLVYVELFVVDAICLWCTVVHVIAFGLFVTALAGAAR